MKRICTLALAFAFTAVGVYAYAGDAVNADVYQDYRQTVLPLREQLSEKRAQLDSMYADGNVDQSCEQSLIREIGDLQAQLYAVRAKMHSRHDAIGDYNYGDMGYHHRDDHRGNGRGMGHHGGGRHGGHCW